VLQIEVGNSFQRTVTSTVSVHLSVFLSVCLCACLFVCLYVTAVSVTIYFRRAALAGRSSAGAVQAVCNGPFMSAAQSTTVDDRLLHPHCIARRQHLRSAGCHQLFIPRHWRSMFGLRALSVAVLAAWNSLPDYLRDPSCSFDSFLPGPENFFFSFY